MNDIERLRTFVSVRVPVDRLRRVERATASLRESVDGARWVALENQHVTLKFLGWTPVDRIGAIAEALGTVARSHAAARCSLSGLGAFPRPRRARVLWVGIEDPDGLLSRLAEDASRVLEPLGFPTEARPFTAHLTLARLRVPRSLGELPDLDGGSPFDVESFDLMRSHLSPKGARYESLERFELRGSP